MELTRSWLCVVSTPIAGSARQPADRGNPMHLHERTLELLFQLLIDKPVMCRHILGNVQIVCKLAGPSPEMASQRCRRWSCPTTASRPCSPSAPFKA